MLDGKKLIWTSVITAIASSFCCIAPLLAIISGLTGASATIAWMEPFRPYLIGFTFLVLCYAWYLKLKPKTEIDCVCETDELPKSKSKVFYQSKLFLGLITVFSIFMLAFPYYSYVFYPSNQNQKIVVNKENIQAVKIGIKGMTCVSCEVHLNHSINQLSGILKIESSYENSNAKVEFDSSSTTIEEIEKTINKMGYSVINKEFYED